MASDEAYSAFLDQANQDTGATKASTKSTSATTKAIDTDVPVSLQKIEQYYISEADEPFEPVSLKWNGSNMPSESKLVPRVLRSESWLYRGAINVQLMHRSLDEFKDLIGHSSNVSTLSAQEFDPKGQYKDVLQAVEEAGDGKARIFRVDHGRARAEYYVISLETKGKKVLGLKAKAVES